MGGAGGCDKEEITHVTSEAIRGLQRFLIDSNSEEDRRKAISNILVRLDKKQKMDEGERVPISVKESLSDEDKTEEENIDDKNTLIYLPESFMVAIYQNEWYVGQVLSKDGQLDAGGGGPVCAGRLGEVPWQHLQVVKQDGHLECCEGRYSVHCDPPVSRSATSSTRVINNLSLTEKDFKTANAKFQHTQAY